MDWELTLVLDPGVREAMYLRVARAIRDDIRRGRLPAGTSLPGTRRLAAVLGIHRNTTVAAYRELASEGWVDTVGGSGTFVTAAIHGAASNGAAAKARSDRDATAYPLPRRPGPAELAEPPSAAPSLLALSHLPDPRLAPQVALARAYRRALRHPTSALLDYANRRHAGATFGHARLREALAGMLSRTRGLAVTADDVLVTGGSQMALYLAALALVRPGDTIAVEGLGYRPVWEAFRLAGATVVPIPVDEDGLQVEVLQRVASQTPVRAVYVTPHHQHPTGVALGAARRAALLRLAVSARMAILEDDFDSDFDYEGRTTLPLASADEHGAVVYVGSLSKVLAPGLRIGYAVAPRPVLELMAERRAFIDRQGDHVLDCAVAELIEDGQLRRHVQRVRTIYAARRAALAEALTGMLGADVTFRPPERGTAIWATVRDDIDVQAWHDRARQRGVSFSTGRSLRFDDASTPHARFGFAGLDAPQLREAVKRLRAALPEPRARSRPVRATIREPDLLRTDADA
jgi:GntR family transcriptional regulator/MocR family aminotransferase